MEPSCQPSPRLRNVDAGPYAIKWVQLLYGLDDVFDGYGNSYGPAVRVEVIRLGCWYPPFHYHDTIQGLHQPRVRSSI